MAVTDHPRRSVIAAVDDDQRILRSLELLLESADYDVRLFSSATALLESGGLREIDCLISDIGMPVMDGFELVRGIQAATARVASHPGHRSPRSAESGAARLATSLSCVQEAVQRAGTSHGRRRCSAEPATCARPGRNESRRSEWRAVVPIYLARLSGISSLPAILTKSASEAASIFFMIFPR